MKDYIKDFETYFNTTIQFKTEEDAFQYEQISYDFYEHYAWFKFRVKTPL
ncbi:MAG: hypothetical protein HRT67_00640 [Flavobacteriaceae bacterium]|nr:hypothetical protein [Flavobacteriaceae bacterium]